MTIFSGDYSSDMWKAINTATTVDKLRDALYFVCCRLQELESEIARAQPSLETRLVAVEGGVVVKNGYCTDCGGINEHYGHCLSKNRGTEHGA